MAELNFQGCTCPTEPKFTEREGDGDSGEQTLSRGLTVVHRPTCEKRKSAPAQAGDAGTFHGKMRC